MTTVGAAPAPTQSGSTGGFKGPKLADLGADSIPSFSDLGDLGDIVPRKQDSSASRSRTPGQGASDPDIHTTSRMRPRVTERRLPLAPTTPQNEGAEPVSRRLPLSPSPEGGGRRRSSRHTVPRVKLADTAAQRAIRQPSRPGTPPRVPPPLAEPTFGGDDEYQPELQDATVVDDGLTVGRLLAAERILQQQAQEGAAAAEPDLPEIRVVAAVDPAKLTPFLSLPDYALDELAHAAVAHELQAGEVVLREGEPGESCYVVASGEVQVLKRDPLSPDAPFFEVARLTDGALFGEFALLGDKVRHATVETTRATTLYEVSRTAIDNVATCYPDVRPILESFYRDRMLDTLMLTAPFFRVLNEEQRAKVRGLFEPVRAAPNQVIIQEGAKSGGFYLILLGTVRIDKRLDGGETVEIASLGEGAYFGEVSLLRGEPAQATVTAQGTVELARLEAKRFYSLVASIPMLWAQVWKEANRRELETLQIVAGVTGSV
jgi:CRP-like cAMP-binding protein